MFSYITNKIEKNIVMTAVILLVFHASVTIVLSLIGNSEYFLNLHNFDGFWYFASDAMTYQAEAIESLKFLEDSQWINWWYAFQSHAHVRFISLIYWLTNTTNPIAFEIINGPIWVACVFLIYRTSQGLFSKSVVAPIISTLFLFQPSVLLHSTSLLRDNFVIFSICLLCYGWVLITKNKFSLKAIIYLVAGTFIFLSLKDYLIVPMLIIFLTFLTYALVARKISAINILIMATFLILVFSFIGISEKGKAYRNNDLTRDISDKGNIAQKLYNSSNTTRIDLEKNKSFIDSYNKSKFIDIDNVLPEIFLEEIEANELINVKLDKYDALLPKSFQEETPITPPVNAKNAGAEKQVEVERQRLVDAKNAGAEKQVEVERQRLADELKQKKSLLQTYLLKMNQIKITFEKKIPPRVRSLELREISDIEKFLNMISQIEIRIKDSYSLIEQANNLQIIELNNLMNINKNLLLARSEKLLNDEIEWQSQPKIVKILDLASARVLEFRTAFYVQEAATGSMVDESVIFVGFNDILSYLPRAVQVGFLAPFPNQWGDTGEMTGRIGRIIAAIEMTILYIVLIGFLYIVFTNFSLLIPLIPSVILSSFIIVLVAYAVPNIGALYRFRMDQILPIYIIGIIGVELLINKMRNNSILK